MAGSELKQTAGYWTALALSIGSVAGTTLFFGPAIGAQFSGNLTIIASILLGFIAVYIATIFGELVAMFPKAGGAYEFGKQTYGRFVSFLIGWVAWIVGNIATVVIIVGAVNAILPDSLLANYETQLLSADVMRIALTMLLLLLLNVVAFVGIEAGGIVLIILSAVTVAIVALAVGAGFTHFSPGNVLPLATHPYATIFVTLFFMVETFFGWEGATYLAEETKNPRKTIPRAIIHATLIVAVLLTVSIFVTLSVFPWSEAAELSNPLASMAELAFGPIGALLVGVGVFLALIGAAAGGVITMPRLVLSLARDRLFLGTFKDVHPRFKTPHKAVIFQTLVLFVLVFMGVGSYQTLLSLLVPLALIMYIFLVGAVPILRRTHPEIERPFKAPFGSWLPIVIVFLFIAMMIIWAITVPGASILLRLSVSLIGIGLPLYLLAELYYDPKAITEFNDISAYATLVTEKFTFSDSIVRDVLLFLGPINGKTILEFGCGVGSLTMPLLKEVGPHGKVLATHFSRNHLKITRKRADTAAWETEGRLFGELVAMHDPEHFKRVHPNVTYADNVVSIGMLGYVQDMPAVLKQMQKILPVGGRICFIEYSDFFHLLPNVEWMASDAQIEKMFRDAGFSVKVVRKKSLLWNRVFLYGIKYTKDVAFV